MPLEGHFTVREIFIFASGMVGKPWLKILKKQVIPDSLEKNKAGHCLSNQKCEFHVFPESPFCHFVSTPGSDRSGLWLGAHCVPADPCRMGARGDCRTGHSEQAEIAFLISAQQLGWNQKSLNVFQKNRMPKMQMRQSSAFASDCPIAGGILEGGIFFFYCLIKIYSELRRLLHQPRIHCIQ